MEIRGNRTKWQQTLFLKHYSQDINSLIVDNHSWYTNFLSWTCGKRNMPLFREGKIPYIALLLSVCRQSVGPPTIFVHFLRRGLLNIELKFGNRFFTRTSRSNSVLSTKEQILRMPLARRKIQLFFFHSLSLQRLSKFKITCTDESRKMCVFYANYNLKTFDNIHVILDRLMHFVWYW